MNIVAIMFGRRGSVGLPGKNITKLIGRPCCHYPIAAVQAAEAVKAIYVSTDDPKIAAIALKLGAVVLDRPAELATADAPLEDAIGHAFREAVARARDPIDAVVLLQANAPCITAAAITEGIRMIAGHEDLDSAVTVCELSQFAPSRARSLDGDLVVPVMPPSKGSGRHSGGKTYFGDGGATVVRPSILETMRDQPGPYPWQGRTIGAVIQNPNPGDIDQHWQLAAAESWLAKAGWTQLRSPYSVRARRRTPRITVETQPFAVEGLRVALIGRADYLGTSELGAAIDGADFVIRVNWHLPIHRQLFPHVGSRTDMLYLCPSNARSGRQVSARRLGIPLRVVDLAFRSALTYRAMQEFGAGRNYIPNSGTVAVFDLLEAGAAEIKLYGFDLHASGRYVDSGQKHNNRERWARLRGRGVAKAHHPEIDRALMADLMESEARFQPDGYLRSVIMQGEGVAA